jgi:hypothetical protein
MKRIKNFFVFINEDLKSDIIEKIEPERKQIKEFLIDKIIETLKTEDLKEVLEFIDEYLRDSEKNKINGLTEKSDIISFWEQYVNDIDEVLSEIKFFNESPSDMGCYSSYDYIEKLTEKAIKEILMAIKSDLEGSETEESEEG